MKTQFFARILAFPALTLTFALPDATAQQTTLDGFSWSRTDFELRANHGPSARASYTTWSDAIGGETDIVMTMSSVSDTTAFTKLFASPSGLQFLTDGSARSQWFISYDGIDLSADTVRATSGLHGFDLTVDGFQDQFVFDAVNLGGPLTVSLFVLSDTLRISTYHMTIAASYDTTDYGIPFDNFSSSGPGADFSSVNAIVLSVDNDGPGVPVDFHLMNLGTALTAQSVASGDSTLYIQRNGAAGGQWFTNQFQAGDPYSAEAADNFTVSAGANWRINGFTIEGSYISGPGANPTARLSIVVDSSGAPSDQTIASYTNLPVVSWNPFYLPLPDTGIDVSDGKYWVTITLNSPPGTEGFFRGSPTPFGKTALWRNPLNGFGYGCTTFTPLNNCFGNDQSFLFSITGTSEKSGADIAVDVNADTDSLVTVGGSVNYTMTVSNIGELASENTEVFVPFGSSTILSIVPSQGACAAKVATTLDASFVCNLEALAPGDTATIAVETIVNGAGRFSGAIVFRQHEFPDENGLNNSASFSGFAQKSLVLKKVANDSEFLVGSDITFELTVRNESSRTVDGVYVQDVYADRAFAHVSDTGDCEEFDYEDAYREQSVELTGLKCQLGSMAPGEERTFEVVFEATETAGDWSNDADAFSSRGLEDRSGATVRLKGQLASPTLMFYLGATGSQTGKSAITPIDIYLNETLLADNVEPGQATPFVTVPITTYPSMLYFVPSQAPDRSSAFDSLEVPLAGVDPGTGTALILTNDADGKTHVVVVEKARLKAANADGFSFALVHAAPTLPAVDASVEGAEITPSPIAFGLPFDASTEFFNWETRIPFNLRVGPEGDDASVEIFGVDLPTSGLAYLLVLGPDSSPGKLDATSLYVVDSQGQTSISEVVTSAETRPEIPAAYALHENYPNPFNPTTRITYDVPKASDIIIAVYDVSGRHVATIVDGLHAAGTHVATWAGRSDSGATVASGVYFYRMIAGSFVASRKMILLK